MTEIKQNPLLNSLERVKKSREAERTGRVVEAEILEPVKTSSSIRARLNVIPDESTLAAKITQALSALARGVRWARGSILNLLV